MAKTDCEVVTYTAIFGSVELTEDEKSAEASDQPTTQAPDADPTEKDNSLNLLPLAVSMEDKTTLARPCNTETAKSSLRGKLRDAVQEIGQRPSPKGKVKGGEVR